MFGLDLVIWTLTWLCAYIQEYSEDSNSEPNVDLENQYYNSKALKEDDPKAALSSFQKVGWYSIKTLWTSNLSSLKAQHLLTCVGFIVCSGIGTRRRERRMGIQSTKTDDQNQLQAGRLCNTCHNLFTLTPSDMTFWGVFFFVSQPCRQIFPRWWTGTNSSLHTSEVLSPGTTQRSPSTPFWTISLPPNR